MKTEWSWAAVVALAIPLSVAGAEKPRVFITESQSLQLLGDASIGDTKGSLLLMGGTSPQSVEVMKNFIKRCPGVIVTATPFVQGNKIAVFNKDQDLIYSGSTRFLGNAVKDACGAITGRSSN
jgi:hypothetical protein